MSLLLPTSSAAVENTCATPSGVRSSSVKLVQRPDFAHSGSPVRYGQRAVDLSSQACYVLISVVIPG